MKSKTKLCAVCRKPFVIYRTTQKVCGVHCALAFNRGQDAKAKQKRQKAKDNRWREDNKTMGKWAKEAQTEFNRYIRTRDSLAGHGCISCDKPAAVIEAEQGWKQGGIWDCGHYLGVGAYPELRYCIINAHRQCKSCNSGSYNHVGKGRSVAASYRVNLINRIGLDFVEWLEAPHEMPQRRADDYKYIKELYRARTKELQ